MGCFEMYCTLCGGPLSGCIYTMNSDDTEWMKRLVLLETHDDSGDWSYDGHGRINNASVKNKTISDCTTFAETSYLPVSLKAAHEICWIVCGEPTKLQINKKNPLKTYQGQGFAANHFREDFPEGDWMFLNPMENKRNKKRIIDLNMQYFQQQ